MEMTYVKAINSALLEEMRRDENVFVMGEDVAELGGHSKPPKACWRRLARNGLSIRPSPKP